MSTLRRYWKIPVFMGIMVFIVEGILNLLIQELDFKLPLGWIAGSVITLLALDGEM